MFTEMHKDASKINKFNVIDINLNYPMKVLCESKEKVTAEISKKKSIKCMS